MLLPGVVGGRYSPATRARRRTESSSVELDKMSESETAYSD